MAEDLFSFFIVPETPDLDFKNPKRYTVFRKFSDELIAIVSYDWNGDGFRIRYEVDLPRWEQDQLVAEAKTLGRWLFKPDL